MMDFLLRALYLSETIPRPDSNFNSIVFPSGRSMADEQQQMSDGEITTAVPPGLCQLCRPPLGHVRQPLGLSRRLRPL